MDKIKNIAVVAHDNCKSDLLDFIDSNRHTMIRHNLVATGTTGKLVRSLLQDKATTDAEKSAIKVNRLTSGPLGGDQQLGAMIANGEIDVLIFFWDPMEPQPHDVDVKALLRLAVLYNIPTACNRSSAEFLASSPFLDTEFSVKEGEYLEYANRKL